MYFSAFRSLLIVSLTALFAGIGLLHFAQASFIFDTNGIGGNDLTRWYKADAGVTVTASGLVSAWDDQSGNGKHVSQTTDIYQPRYVTGGNTVINFNPTIGFDGLTDLLSSATDVLTGTVRSYYAVARAQGMTGLRNIFAVGYTAFFNFKGAQFGMDHLNRVMYGEKNASTYQFVTGVIQYPLYTPLLMSFTRSGAAANSTKVYGGGAVGADGQGTITIAQATDVRSCIGCRFNDQFWTGEIAEVLTYNIEHTLSERNIVESYLAAKYGITKDQTVANNYTDSSGNVFRDATANALFTHNITVLGRDDGTSLYQKQSKSANNSGLITVGLGSIESNNNLNTNIFASDKSFLAFGDDNGLLEWSLSGAPSGRKILGRIYKAYESIDTTNYMLSVPDSSSALPTKLPSSSGSISLLVDADGDFSSGAVETILTLSGTNWIGTADIDNGQFFTFAMILPPVLLTTDTGSISESGGVANLTIEIWSGATIDTGVVVTLSYGGTASDGVDYSTGATEVLIASGTTGTSLSITALQDALIEGSETIIVTITSVSTGVSLSGMQTQIITLFDDEAPVVSSSSGGGGGGGGLTRDRCPSGDSSPSYYDGSCGEASTTPSTPSTPSSPNDDSEEPGTIPSGSDRATVLDTIIEECAALGSEDQQSYCFAYAVGSTTKPSLEEALYDEGVTREQLAKMMTEFALTILGRDIDTTKECSFADNDDATVDLRPFIQQACQGYLMGVDSLTGLPLTKFRPKDTVTRGELVTVLSRMLYGDSYDLTAGDANDTDFSYHHMAKMYEEGIITQLYPERIASRREAFIMMYRLGEKVSMELRLR